MIVNSPCATSAMPTFRLCRALEAADAGPQVAGADLPDERQHDRQREQPAHAAGAADIDREAEDEEEQRGEEVAEAEEALLDLLAHRGLGEHDARHQRADRLREPELLRDRGHARRGTRTRPAGRTRAASRSRKRSIGPLSHCDAASAAAMNAERLGDDRERVGRPASAARREAQHDRDHEVLERRGSRARGRSRRPRAGVKSISPLTVTALEET